MPSIYAHVKAVRFVHIRNSEKLMMRIEAQNCSDRELGGPLKDSEQKIYTSRSNVRTSTHTEIFYDTTEIRFVSTYMTFPCAR